MKTHRKQNNLVTDVHIGANTRFDYKIFNCGSDNHFITDSDFRFEIFIGFCYATQLTWLNKNVSFVFNFVW